MKIALLTGFVKKGEEIAEKYLEELNLPVKPVFSGIGKKY